MSEHLFDAARRVEVMIGREDALEQIKQAIYANDRTCRVVLVTGPGGIGKSRLLEEVQARAGHPRTREEEQQRGHARRIGAEDWTSLDEVVVSDAVDLTDIRLTSRARLLQALRDALSYDGGIDFGHYDRALSNYQRTLEAGAGFSALAQAEYTAEADFWRDYEKHAAGQHILLILDTAERLVLDSSSWLKQHTEFLTEEDWSISSDQWLLQQLKKGRFLNTTLIIAGRDEEGKRLFEEISKLRESKGKACRPIKVSLQAFGHTETEAYFAQVAREWRERAQSEDASFATRQTAETMAALAEDLEHLQTLHLLTGGRPVLLSLYSDLLNEPIDFPDPLRLAPKQMRAEIDAGKLKEMQKEVEQVFIDALFQRPGRRTEIMQALARAPMGLDAAQLHFVLDSITIECRDWKATSTQQEEIERHLRQISRLSIARPRPGGRMGLQDEIYRIYADRMADTEALHRYESEIRQTQYRKLVDWAETELNSMRKQVRELQATDQQRLALAVQSPKDALRIKPSALTTAEQDDVDKFQQDIRDWELQRLHYSILLDPVGGFNDTYGDLAERRWLANNEEADLVAQQEMWRALHDEYAMRFVSAKGQLEKLQRAAREEDPTRWIKRLILRREFSRAVELYRIIEKTILRVNDKDSTMSHPMNAYERQIWRDYARIMIGKEAQPATQSLVGALKCLVKLSRAHGPVSCGKAWKTNGYKGHPALPRLQRLIAVGYNFLGYGEVVRGQYRQAVEYYGQALLYLREAPMEAQHAATLNNLARALASLGREERGERICQDALSLRRRLGAEIPIAYSLNTLALIKNGRERTPTAWRLATQSLALFRRAGDKRGEGLALIQLGIGLRRLANTEETGYLLEMDVEALYDTAEMALSEAVDIFAEDQEVIRRVEAHLELGCLLRDRLRSEKSSSNRRRRDRLARDADHNLRIAVEAAELEFPFLALQARVDRAWLRFYADDYTHVRATQAAEEAKASVLAGYRIEDQKKIEQRQVETHYYYQLAKIEGLLAAVAMRQFSARRNSLHQQHLHLNKSDFYKRLEEDPETRRYLKDAAENYVLSLYYGQMFSQRSRSLVVTYDQIYNHVKQFNSTEYRMFYQFQHDAAEKYRKQMRSELVGEVSDSQATPYDFSRLDGWLNDCFGPVE